MVRSSPVAVIDIGSNSIKVLVAAPGADGTVAAQYHRTIDARISSGISAARPVLSAEGMARGLEAVRTLLAETAPYAPVQTALVATSAVRDALNGDAFRSQVQAATGHLVRLLSGEEEANLIGRGLLCDPALAGLRDFYLFDLGGGSLECLAFRDRRMEQAVSLQLGCVRLMEECVPNPAAPLAADAIARISARVQAEILRSFRFSLPAGSVAIGTGGTIANARSVLAARSNVDFSLSSPTVTVRELRELLTWIGGLPLEARRQIQGLPPGRADIFPTALATFLALAETGGFGAYQNSLYNLRFGVAAELMR